MKKKIPFVNERTVSRQQEKKELQQVGFVFQKQMVFAPGIS